MKRALFLLSTFLPLWGGGGLLLAVYTVGFRSRVWPPDRAELPMPIAPSPATAAATLVTLLALWTGLVLWLREALGWRRLTPWRAATLALASWFLVELPLMAAEWICPPLFRGDPALRARLNPGVKGWAWAYGETRAFWVEVNRRGMRGPEVSDRPPSGSLRVLILGDSALFGSGVDQPYVVSEQLREVLSRERPDVAVEVYNGAIPGSNSSEGVYLLLRDYGDLRPDVVVMGYNNDSVPIGPAAPVPGVDDGGKGPGGRLRLERLAYHSRVYLALRRLRLYEIGPERITGWPIRPLHRFLANTRRVAEWCRAHEARLLLLLLPRNERGLTLHESLSDPYREALRREARRLGVDLLDLQKLGGGFWTPERFINPRDVTHPGAEGQAWMARQIARWILATTPRSSPPASGAQRRWDGRHP